MNIKRLFFWLGFLVLITLIVWGLIVAMNKAPVSPNALQAPALVTAADHVRGPADASVTLIEYSDFQCPACASYYPLVERLMSGSSTTVRFVYRHFPLYPLPHKNALFASQAAEAAGAQGKFWEMYRVLFENQSDWAELSDVAVSAQFMKYAAEIGLDSNVFKVDFDSDVAKNKIQADRDNGTSIGVNSTPTFFVNGKSITNPRGYDEFKSIIDAAAAGAQ